MMSTVVTTTESSGPISVRAAVRRLFARASNRSQSASAAGIFDRARNTRIQQANFIMNQRKISTVVDWMAILEDLLSIDGDILVDCPPTDNIAGGLQSTEDAHASSSRQEYDPLPSPRRMGHDVYVDHLITLQRGYPLWLPSPSTTLPNINRKTGVSIGDVGILTPEGGFDFIFNILHDAAHPINAALGVPQGFLPFSPALTSGFNEWNAGSCLSDHTTVIVNDQQDRYHRTITVEARGPETAMLMIPKGISTRDLRITAHLREYIEKNIAAWYKFAKHTHGYNIENGDLRVVYGCQKSSGFGIAAAFNTSQAEKTRLSFSVDSTWADISGYPYRWNYTGSAEVKAGPSQQEFSDISGGHPVNNQCLFVRTIDTKLSAELWRRIEEQKMITSKNDHVHMTFNSTQAQHRSMPGPAGGSHRQGAESLPYDRSLERVAHPSAIVLNVMEMTIPGVPVYMVCNDDWAIKDKNETILEFLEGFLVQKILVEYKGMICLSDQQQKDSEDKAAVSITEFNSPGPGADNGGEARHWQAKRTAIKLDAVAARPSEAKYVGLGNSPSLQHRMSSSAKLYQTKEAQNDLLAKEVQEVPFATHVGVREGQITWWSEMEQSQVDQLLTERQRTRQSSSSRPQ